VHKWYAILVSETSAFEGTKEKIKKAYMVKEHFTRATELNPQDATSRHALGMWYYEVANVSWATRKVAAAIFASPPTGTLDEALAHFNLAESTSPGFYIRNRLMIGKCHKELGERAAAKKWAALATELPIVNSDDVEAADLAKQLHASL